MAGSEGCPCCGMLHVDIVISEDKPWGQCLWVTEIWEEEWSCRILFMHCFQHWGSVHISAVCRNAHQLISLLCVLSLAKFSPLSFASKCFCCTPVTGVPGTWTLSTLQFRFPNEKQAGSPRCSWGTGNSWGLLLKWGMCTVISLDHQRWVMVAQSRKPFASRARQSSVVILAA